MTDVVRLCQVLGCEERHYAKGRCRSHYRQWMRGVRSALLDPEIRRGEPPERRSPGLGRPSGSSRGRRTASALLAGPPFGWGHLPLVADADGHLPEGTYFDQARLDWGRYVARHIEAVLRDMALPWWELGQRVPWAAHNEERT